MILLFPLVLLGIVFVCRSSGSRCEGWRWFWAWACFGGLFVLGLLTGFSIGLLLLPVAAVVGVAVARRAAGWREALGAVAGAAVAAEVLAALNGWTTAHIRESRVRGRDPSPSTSPPRPAAWGLRTVQRHHPSQTNEGRSSTFVTHACAARFGGCRQTCLAQACPWTCPQRARSSYVNVTRSCRFCDVDRRYAADVSLPSHTRA
jgi:hypothetical protein